MTGPADLLFARLRELRDQYREAHHNGMEALERHDLGALHSAIQEERRILDEQTTLIADLRPLHPLNSRPEDSAALTDDEGEREPDRS
jgi:hypothetical protein